MERVAHGIVDATYVIRDVVIEMPYVGCRHGDEFRETTVPVNANDLRVRADMGVAGAAQQAAAIDYVPLGCYAVAFTHVFHKTPHLHDVSCEFVSYSERRLAPASRPVVPLVDMNVGAAHSGTPYTNENFILADLRTRHITQFESRTCSNFYECFQSELLEECDRTIIAIT
jgi:hypothetical protein